MLLLSGKVLAAPPETRASHLGMVSTGTAEIMHMEDYLKDYPASHTAVLSYLRLDTEEVFPVIRYMKTNAAIQARAGREFWPQVAIETSNLNLADFRRELSRQGSQIDISVRTLAYGIARFKARKKWFFIRPFSEMNDATESAPWEFGLKARRNTPADFAAAWKLLRDVFNEEGATNAIFIFSPLAANRVHGEKEVLEALNKIPVGYIDAFGLNVYARPRSAYSGTSPEPIPFTELVQPWLKVLASSKQRGLPLAVAEMGISNQAADADRAQWLRDAFTFARANNFVMITYFNYPHRYWKIDMHTLAGAALKAEMDKRE